MMIAAVDKNNALGKNGQLLCHLPVDLKHFKQATLHQSVLMGRKTFESIGHALPQRENFVLTHQKNLLLPDCICVNTLEEAILKKNNENLWVIGGAEIYALCLPFTDKILLTHIDHPFKDADAFFPTLDPAQWKIVFKESHPVSEKNNYALKFVTYETISTEITPFQ